MRKFGVALAIPLLLLTPAASAQTGKAEKPEAGQKAAAKMSVEEFLTKTAKANQFEIDASKLAVDKAKSKEVKGLAQGLVSDHTAAAEKLKAAVQADGKLALPKDDKPNAKHAKTLEKLKEASDDAFDRAYLEAMLTGHKESLERYKGYAASGDNAHLKKFAEEIAPIVEAHLEAVQKAAAALAEATVLRSAAVAGAAKASPRGGAVASAGRGAMAGADSGMVTAEAATRSAIMTASVTGRGTSIGAISRISSQAIRTTATTITTIASG